VLCSGVLRLIGSGARKPETGRVGCIPNYLSDPELEMVLTYGLSAAQGYFTLRKLCCNGDGCVPSAR